MQRKKETTTTFLRKEDRKQKWYLFDATGKTLGRLCSEIAKVLCGKHRPSYTPHVDTGDGVIVIHADKVAVSGQKEGQKIYRYYTGHIGGLREVPYRQMRDRKPEHMIERGVQGMMPKSRLGKQQLRKLRVFKGSEHPFEAQKPIYVEI